EALAGPGPEPARAGQRSDHQPHRKAPPPTAHSRRTPPAPSHAGSPPSRIPRAIIALPAARVKPPPDAASLRRRDRPGLRESGRDPSPRPGPARPPGSKKVASVGQRSAGRPAPPDGLGLVIVGSPHFSLGGRPSEVEEW